MMASRSPIMLVAKTGSSAIGAPETWATLPRKLAAAENMSASIRAMKMEAGCRCREYGNPVPDRADRFGVCPMRAKRGMEKVEVSNRAKRACDAAAVPGRQAASALETATTSITMWFVPGRKWRSVTRMGSCFRIPPPSRVTGTVEAMLPFTNMLIRLLPLTRSPWAASRRMMASP